jgi:hypothetical protein
MGGWAAVRGVVEFVAVTSGVRYREPVLIFGERRMKAAALGLLWPTLPASPAALNACAQQASQPPALLALPERPSQAPPEGQLGARSIPSIPAETEARSDASFPFQAPVAALSSALGSSASRFANLSPAQCKAELSRRAVSAEHMPLGNSGGVSDPVRITGPLHGVQFLAPGARSVYGKLDCRLALVLDELAKVLEQHHVVKVRIDNLYRPHAHLPGKSKPSQHAYGLAMDLTALELDGGRSLIVETDWEGTLHAPVCGPESAVTPPTDQAIALRNIVCDVARRGLFHHILTPNYDIAHNNHLHFDIKRECNRLVVE